MKNQIRLGVWAIFLLSGVLGSWQASAAPRANTTQNQSALQSAWQSVLSTLAGARDAAGNQMSDSSGDAPVHADISNSCSTVVATTADTNAGSLRAAVDCSNITAGTQTITFDPAVTPTIKLTTGELLLTDSVIITGPGASTLAVDGNAASRVFEINAGVTATISGLTINNGKVLGASGADASGGGILNNGTLNLNFSQISNNTAQGGDSPSTPGQGRGGGVYNSGTLNVSNSTLNGNIVRGGAGTTGNTPAGKASGGGIYNATGATTTIKNSTISTNQAVPNVLGNGIYFANDFTGGGVYSDGSLTLQNSTVAFNIGIGLYIASGTADLSSTIVAKNNANGGTLGSDVGGAATGSFNLIGDGTGETGITNGTNNNQVGTSAAPIDPLLQPLQYNGGTTKVHPIGIGSPAIDKGTANGFSTDQRGSGFPRIFDDTSTPNASDGTDVGAYELEFTDLGACTTVVSNNLDFGPGTLRRAMDCANATPAADTISFAIPGTGVHTIMPASDLPALTAPVTIDGLTQNGSTPNTNVEGAINAHLTIEIDGENVGLLNPPILSFVAGSDNSTVRGLVINRALDTYAIGTVTVNNFHVEGCFIGSNASGTGVPTFGNTEHFYGVSIEGGSGLRIGGTRAQDRNLIDSIKMDGVGDGAAYAAYLVSDVEIRGNLIGTSAAGTAAFPDPADNDGIAVVAESGLAPTPAAGTIHDVRIGMPGTGGGNIISGKGSNGILLITVGSEFASAINPVPPTFYPGAIRGVTIRNNRIGTNAAGTAAVPNGTGSLSGGGIAIENATADATTFSDIQIGGVGASESNLISGNIGSGTSFFNAAGVTIQGNLIGTNAAGTAAIGNGGAGVVLEQGTGATIGGASAAARNIISGNTGDGVAIVAVRSGGINTVQGNYIGTDVSGAGALPNGTNGVKIDDSTNSLIGGSNAGEGNVISGNTGNGVFIESLYSHDNSVVGNLIGRNAANTGALGNGGHGVLLQGCGPNTIGGQSAGSGNVIAHNGGDGVSVVSLVDPSIGSGEATGESILGNSIFSNTGLGIDLANNGVTANDTGDADSGANNLQNFPVLTSASVNGGNLTIAGNLNSTPNSTFRIEFFASASADPTGYGEGQTFLGSTDVTTDGNGDATINAVLAVSLPSGQSVITSTATKLATLSASHVHVAIVASTPSDTSEFSQAITATSAQANNGTLQFSSPTYSVNESGPTATITVTRTGGSAGAVSAHYATSNGTATAGSDYTAKSGTISFADGDTANKTFTIPITDDTLDEPDETVNLTLSTPTGGVTIGAQSTAVLTIVDNDNPPTISIGDVSMTEGNSGTKTFAFTVSLSTKSGKDVSVNYATANGTTNPATAGSDYVAVPSTLLTIPAGSQSAMINVTVNGDTIVEPNETFFVNLSTPTNATIADSQGVGTIQNDDSSTPPPPPSGPQNVTSRVGVNGGSFKTAPYLPGVSGAGKRTQTVTLTNSSGATIQGPVSLVLDNLKNGKLNNSSGKTQVLAPLGSPYVNVNVGSDGVWSAGEKISVTLEFAPSGSSSISYTTRVLAGSGAR